MFKLIVWAAASHELMVVWGYLPPPAEPKPRLSLSTGTSFETQVAGWGDIMLGTQHDRKPRVFNFYRRYHNTMSIVAEDRPAADAIRYNLLKRYADVVNAPPTITVDYSSGKNQAFRLVHRVRMMKYDVTMAREMTSVITLSATRDGTSSIYAFIYCAGNTPRYICTGPTYRSQDGEYRGRLARFARIDELYETFPTKFDMVDALITPRVATGRLTFQANFYPAADATADELASVVSGRLPVRLFCICWMADSFSIHAGFVENHINPAYQHLMFMDELTSDAAHIHADHASFRSPPGQAALFYDADKAGPRFGQKVFPLNAGGMVRGDILREINATVTASNLVLNSISPSFAFVNDWVYINGAHAGLFDNFAMHERFTRSATGADIASELRRLEARADAPELAELTARIEAAADYADTNVVIANRACVVTTEHVGVTWRDMPKLIVSGIHSPELGCTFRQHGVFRGLMLELTHALCCLHARAGLIHGDLHMNNICVAWTARAINDDFWACIFNAKKAYIMSPERIYQADYIGLNAMIIDFSRAVSARHSDYAGADDARARLVALALHYEPKLDRARVEDLSRRDYALLFKVCSALDALVLFTNLATLFAVEPLLKGGRGITVKPVGEPLNVAPGNIELVDELVHHSRRLFLDGIKRALAGKSVDRWPLDELLERVFAPDLVGGKSVNHVTAYHDPSKPSVFIDAFNTMNEMKYDASDYDMWGPVLTPQDGEAIVVEGRLEYHRKDVEALRKHKYGIEAVPKIHGGAVDDAWMFE